MISENLYSSVKASWCFSAPAKYAVGNRQHSQTPGLAFGLQTKVQMNRHNYRFQMTIIYVNNKLPVQKIFIIFHSCFCIWVFHLFLAAHFARWFDAFELMMDEWAQLLNENDNQITRRRLCN